MKQFIVLSLSNTVVQYEKKISSDLNKFFRKKNSELIVYSRISYEETGLCFVPLMKEILWKSSG